MRASTVLRPLSVTSMKVTMVPSGTAFGGGKNAECLRLAANSTKLGAPPPRARKKPPTAPPLLTGDLASPASVFAFNPPPRSEEQHLSAAPGSYGAAVPRRYLLGG